MKTNFRFKIPMQLFAFVTFFVPIVVIPFTAYVFNDWWILVGLFAVFAGVLIADSKPKLFYIFPPLCVAFWIEQGFNIHHLVTFSFFCFLFGFIFYTITLEYQKLFKRELISNI